MPVEGSEYVIETDSIITAIGEQADLAFMKGEGFAAIANDFVNTDPMTLETGINGVFAGGDATTGPATVVEAMAAGRRAAVSIDRYFNSQSLSENRENEGPRNTNLKVDITGIGKAKRLQASTLPIEKRKRSFEEVEIGYTQQEAMEEAERCLSCECRLCINMLGCPAIIKDEKGEVIIDDSQCPGCGICAQICPNEAILAGEKS